MTVRAASPIRPRIGTERDLAYDTLGGDAAAFAEAVWGEPWYEWQRYVADVGLEVDERGRMRYPVVVCVVPRRAGKSRLSFGVSLYRAIDPGSFTWYTAQDGKNAAAKFRLELMPTLRSSPLAERFGIRSAAGNEHVQIDGGGVFKLFAPTAEQVHGFDGDCVVIDEAWSFDMSKGQALEAAARPAGITRGGSFQLWIVSAGGDESSTWLDHWQSLGRAGTPGVAYFEWSADAGADDYDPYDPATIEAAHPAVAEGRIPVEAILEQAATMERDVFERSYLGVWARPSERVLQRIDPIKWAACANPDATADAAPVYAFGVDVAQDRESAAIVAAGRDGTRVVVETIDTAPGVDWVVPAVRRLHARRPGVPIYLDALSCASVVAELKRSRTPVTVTSASDMAAACAVLVDLVNGGNLEHRDHPGLDAAVAAASTRKVRDGFAWSRRDSALDISPLVAATVAVYGAMTTVELQKPSIGYAAAV